ncbi:MAG: hypothetical protein WDO13_16450 [Verrucomicrobiota bacterium]
MRFRAQRGWGEFDSSIYLGADWECLCCLYDDAPDAALRELAGKMMDLLLADMAVDSLRGMYGGAQGRIYPPHALDHTREPVRVLQYLYFGLFDPGAATGHGFLPRCAGVRLPAGPGRGRCRAQPRRALREPRAQAPA